MTAILQRFTQIRREEGAAGMSGELVFEPNGGYVVVGLSNFDPPTAGRVLNFIVDRLPTPTPSGGR